METMIVLTQEQADKVRGRHGKYSALEPVSIDNGSFILPAEVLNDPEHKEVLNFLEDCKYAKIDIIEVKEETKNLYTLSIKETSPVKISVEKSMTIKPVYDIKP